MASTRELWVILRGRDEASRMVHSFARNVRSAANAVKAAQLESQAAAVRQQATLLRTNGQIAEQIRVMNSHVLGLDKQARAYTLSAAQAREYRDTVLRANGATNEQIGAINQSIRTFERRAAVLRAQASVERNAIAAMTTGLDNQVRALHTHAAALDAEARRLREADRAAANHARTLRHLSVGFQQSSDVALGFTFALGAAAAAGAIFMAKSVQATVAYEKQVRLTATQVDGFSGSLKELGNVGIRTANEIGVRFEQIQPALFDIFSSMEVGVKDAEVLLKAFSKAAVAGQTEIQDVSRATIGILNAFGRPIKDVNKILDIQFQLVQEGIGTYEEWTQRIGLVTPSAVRAGQSVEMMAAALATATRMGLSAARSGTSVARAMDAMSHPAAVRNMEELGIKVRDARGKFLPMNTVLRQFRDILNKMPEKDRVKTILDVFKGAGGTIEARRFLQNLLLGKKNIELFDQALKDMQGSSGSMEQAYGIMADSIAVKSELLRNKWQILKIGIGNALVPSLLQLVETLSKALEWFNRLPDSTKNTIAQFLLWGTAIAAAGAALFGIIAIIGFVVAAFVTAGTTILVVIGALTALAAIAVAAGAAFITLWQNSKNFRDLISTLADKVADVKNAIADLAQRGAEAFNDKLRPALEDLWNTIESKVLPVIDDLVQRVADNLLPKLKEAGGVFINNIKPALDEIARVIQDDLIPALNELNTLYQQNKAYIDPIVKALGELIVAAAFVAAVIMGSLIVSLRVLSVVIQAGISWLGLMITILHNAHEALKAAGAGVAKFVTDVVSGLSKLPGAVGNAIGSIVGIVQEVWRRTRMVALTTINSMISSSTGTLSSWPGKVLSAIIGIVGRVASVFAQALGRAASGAQSIVSRSVGVLASLPGRARGAINGIIGAVGSVMASAAGRAFAGGQAIVRSVVSGATGLIGWAAGRLRAAAGSIVQGFLDALPGSPVKWGPLKVLNNGKMGKKIIRMLTSGMESETVALRSAFQGMMTPNPVLRPAGATGYTPGSAPSSPPGSSSGGKVVNNQFYITTQEIDPRKHAADLGWELQGRM